MSLTMTYQADNIDCKIEIKNEEATLTEVFANFVDMTRIMQYQPGSWEHIIDELYGYCVLHVNATKDYDIYEWACDAKYPVY